MSNTITDTKSDSDSTISLFTEECIICYEELSKGKTIILDCCNKKIHKKCIAQWISTPNRDIKCPNCQINLSNTIVKKAQDEIYSKYFYFCYTYLFWGCCWFIFILSICLIIFSLQSDH